MMRFRPTCTTCNSSRRMMTLGHRYWFQMYTNSMTASAPIVFQLIGTSTRCRNCHGVAPSMRAASARLRGIAMKCCRKRKVPVADARKGTIMAR